MRDSFPPVLTWCTILHGASHQRGVIKAVFPREPRGSVATGPEGDEHAGAGVANTTTEGC